MKCRRPPFKCLKNMMPVLGRNVSVFVSKHFTNISFSNVASQFLIDQFYTQEVIQTHTGFSGWIRSAPISYAYSSNRGLTRCDLGCVNPQAVCSPEVRAGSTPLPETRRARRYKSPQLLYHSRTSGESREGRRRRQALRV